MVGTVIAYVRRHHVGLLALLVAMGGTAYAADSIRGKDVVDGSLSGRDIGNQTLQGRDLQAGVVKDRHLDDSAQNPSVSSATVIVIDGALELESGDGFESVSSPGPGLYELTVSDGNQLDCNLATALLSGSIEAKDPATTITVSQVEDETVAVQIRNAKGNLVGLGEDSGAAGFSLLSSC